MALLHSEVEGPVVMLNLLRFKERAGGEAAESGAAAYGRYGAAMTKMVEEGGGRLVWAGRPTEIVIGEEGMQWDMVALVEYPSRKAFIEMTSTPKYNDIHVDREAGLESQWLIACTAAAQFQKGS